MDNRFKLWLGLSLALFIVNFWIQATFFPPKEKPKPLANKPKAEAKVAPEKDDKKSDVKAEAEKPDPDQTVDAGEPVDAKPAEASAAENEETEQQEPEAIAASPEWITLGSADPSSPYRMLVTLTNVGAAVERIELNSPTYRDIDDRSGYIGHLALEDVPKLGGARVRAVGDGTPAALAGIQIGDVITGAEQKQIASGSAFADFLNSTKPKQVIRLVILRDGQQKTLSATTIRRPLEVVHPELATQPLDFVAPNKHDPFSLLLTLQTLDGHSLTAPEGGGPGKELDGLNLWTDAWEINDQKPDTVTFRKALSDGLEITKRFTLAKSRERAGADDPAYHLDVQVSIRNTGEKARTVAYQLDGPTGLPAEGAWYANKVSRNWSAGGLRDVVLRFHGKGPTEIGCSQIAQNKATSYIDTPLDYIAVDAQYFAAALIPQKDQPNDLWFADVRPLRVGELPKETADYKLTNVSFRLTSVAKVLEPDGRLSHDFRFFAGPKRPAIVEQYTAVPFVAEAPVTLDDLVYYGWFGWVAKPMLRLLHGFYWLIPNYGIAIVTLTILVRGLMFPISRKQALSAQKMQELQPQIKVIAEKYKSNPQERQRAQMELFRKHNYNPLAGCLPMFLQLPIFVGLYRSLMVDVELRDAPLISQAVRWCSNLAAPDMLLDWSHIMPEFVTKGQGFFGLGPYLNILPLFTIALFLWQQKMFMPPPTDEQTAMQQKMMQYMMIFMGFMFFKVASGLCLYFIVSSLWGIAERKLLPKTISKGTGASVEKLAALDASASSNGSGNGKSKKKQRS